ncbi:hypothetical protein J3E68DRAFT_417373 [Trichoderma sp. SZMC 28012]
MKLRKWSFLVFFRVGKRPSSGAKTNRQLTRPGNTVDFMLPILTCATALNCRF